MTQSDFHRAEPIYEELPGWWEDISEARDFDDLPAKARDYVLRLEELAGAHDLVHRRRPGPRPDHRAPRRAGGAPVTESTPPAAEPIPRARPRLRPSRRLPGVRRRPARARVSAGSWRPCAGCRIWRCRPTPATTSGRRPPSAPKRWPNCWTRSSAARRQAPAGRSPELPGMGSLLMPPWTVTQYAPDGVEMRGALQPFPRRRQLRGTRRCAAAAVRSVFGMVMHAAGRPISRTGFLHVDYRKVTPIDTPLTVRGWVTDDRGSQGVRLGGTARRRRDLLAEGNGLMVRLLPGQP